MKATGCLGLLVTALHTLRGWTRDVKFYDCVYKELPWTLAITAACCSAQKILLFRLPIHMLIQFKTHCQGNTMWMVASLRCTRFLQNNAGTRLSSFVSQNRESIWTISEIGIGWSSEQFSEVIKVTCFPWWATLFPPAMGVADIQPRRFMPTEVAFSAKLVLCPVGAMFSRLPSWSPLQN